LIDNNGTIDDLYNQAKLIVSNEITLAPSYSLLAKDLSTVTTDSF
jgi:hypothetical protein